MKGSPRQSMNSTMIPVTKTCLPTLDEYMRQLEPIWQSGWITNDGALSQILVETLREYLDVSNIELLANGTLALQLAIKSLDLTGEIITTPFSYVATTTAILWEHCNPIFVDIEAATFCIDPDLIEASITPRTSAILATHVYGYPCAVEKIAHIAKKHGLKVIYDAAHAFGVKLNGQSILNFGDISALSFHATKLFHTAEGGALVCKDELLARQIALLKSFGHIGEDNYITSGINAKMSDLHAAMGLCILPKVSGIIADRQKQFRWYDQLLAACGLIRPAIAAGVEYNFAYYPLVFPSHEHLARVSAALMAQQIMPRRYFHPALNTLPYLPAELKKPCPIAENIASRVLCLPIYYGLEITQIDAICKIIITAMQ